MFKVNKYFKMLAYANAIACSILVLVDLIAISQGFIIYHLTPFGEWIIEIPLVFFGLIFLIIMMIEDILGWD